MYSVPASGFFVGWVYDFVNLDKKIANFVPNFSNFVKMFSGIVEEAAEVVSLRKDEDNLHLTLRSSFAGELCIDQSVAHNGVCLTVVELPGDGTYTVTAIRETLERSNLGMRFSPARL